MRQIMRTALVALAIGGAVSSTGLAAATLTWRSSASAGANWSDAGNWDLVQAPTDGDSLIFAIPVSGGTRTTTNDLPAGTQIAGITVNANLFTFNGNSVALTGDYAFNAQSSNNTAFTNGLAMPVNLAQNVNFSVAGSAGTGMAASRVDSTADISGSGKLTKTGTGTLRLQTVAKTYTGGTLVSAGQLELNALDNLLPYGVGKGDLAIDSGATVANLNTNWNVNGLNNGPNGAGQITRTGSNTRTLTIGNADASGSFSGNITSTGGSSSINKIGTGTQTLGGTITLAGVGTVTGGRLNLDGTSSVGWNVLAGGTLGGTGTLSGTVTVTGKLEPGATNATAVLAMNALTLNGASTSTFDIDGPFREGGYDGVDVTGATAYNGTLNVDFGSTVPGGTFDLFNLGTAPTGSFAAINLTGAYAGSLTNDGSGVWTGTFGGTSFTFTQSTGDLVAVVPEPATLAGMAGVLMLIGRRRRA